MNELIDEWMNRQGKLFSQAESFLYEYLFCWVDIQTEQYYVVINPLTRGGNDPQTKKLSYIVLICNYKFTSKAQNLSRLDGFWQPSRTHNC